MISYEKYKASSCDWIDSIPSHWDTHRVKMLFSLRDERNYKPLNEVNLISLYTSLGVRQHKDIEHTTGNKARNADGYKIVHPDDMVVNILLCWMGAIGRSDYYGVTSPAYDIYKPKTKSVNTKYYNYLMRTPMFAQQCYRAGKGIMAMRWRTYSPQFSNIVVPVPSRDEQDQIVRFLDWKVSGINKLIGIRKKQIAELEELKKAVISRAVTKGIVPDVEMKDSGVKWLGDIPSKWDIVKLKKIVTLSESKVNNSNLPYVGMENVNSWTGKYNLNEQIVSESICPTFIKGNILFGKLRPYLAKAFIADFDGICSGEFLVFKDIMCNSSFLLYYLLSEKFIDNINSSTYGAKMPRASWDYIGIQLVPMPSTNVQEEIVAYLDKKCTGLDNIIFMRKKQINELTELKVRLISDVVTGKIDVRGVEIPEYEYVDDDMTDTDEENESEELTEEQEE